MNDSLILYTSDFCGHAKRVEAMLESEGVPIEIRNISADDVYRDEVVAINNGNASVPTLVFPDGTTLTEPLTSDLRVKLGLKPMGVIGRVREYFGV